MDYFLAAEKKYYFDLFSVGEEASLHPGGKTSCYFNTNSTVQKCLHIWSIINNKIKSCKIPCRYCEF